MGEILVQTGLLFESGYIDSQQNPTGFRYQIANYLTELDQILITELRKDKKVNDYIKKVDVAHPKNCPFCGESIANDAIHCSECGSEL